MANDTAELMAERIRERMADICARCRLVEEGLGNSESDLCASCHGEVLSGDMDRKIMQDRLNNSHWKHEGDDLL